MVATTPKAPQSPGVLSPRRQLLLILTFCFIALVSSFMQMLVIPIVPQLPELLDASLGDTAWVITATLISGAVANPIAGRLGDMYGKRPVILVLVVILIVGSVVAALADSLWGVILGRVMQGGSLGVIAVSLAIMRDRLSPGRLATGAAIVSAAAGGGGALGLPLSGIVLEAWGWHAVFWLGAALGAISLVLVLTLVPGGGTVTPGRFDLVGALGIAVGVSAVLIAASRGAEWGWTHPATLGLGLGGVAVMGLWVGYELRRDDPLVDLRMASRPTVLVTNSASVLIGLGSYAGLILFPQIIAAPPPSGLGLSAGVTGLLIMSAGVVMVLLAPVAARLGARLGPRPVLIIGAAALAAAYGFVAVFNDEGWHYIVAQALIGIGSGFSFAAIPVIIMGAVPSSHTAASNGLNSLLRAFGSTVGAAGIGAILAATASPESVPTTEGFQLTLWILVVIAVAGFVLALLIPGAQAPARRRGPRAEPDSQRP